uniref:Uncharacterized protein n=1 Tax=Vitis vinifera TaxID=29760 RepID=F6HTQ2_VITVI
MGGQINPLTRVSKVAKKGGCAMGDQSSFEAFCSDEMRKKILLFPTNDANCCLISDPGSSIAQH